MRRLHLCLRAALGLASSALAGCSPQFDHVDFVERTSPPLPASITSTAIAVAVTATAMAGETKLDKAKLDLVTSDPDALGLETSTDEGFVIFGVRPGKASIRVFIDGDAKEPIPVLVMAQ